jgi:hypothetical protein
MAVCARERRSMEFPAHTISQERGGSDRTPWCVLLLRRTFQHVAVLPKRRVGTLVDERSFLAPPRPLVEPTADWGGG